MAPLTYPAFKKLVEESLNKFFAFTEDSLRSGQLSAPPGYSFLFPTTLIFTKTRSHYVFELIGVRKSYKRLTVKNNDKVSDFNRLVGGFDPDKSTVYMISTEDSSPANTANALQYINLGSEYHFDELDRRFPGFSQIYPNTQIVMSQSVDSFMSVNAQRFPIFILDHCLLTSNVGQVVRAKLVNFLLGAPIGIERLDLSLELDRHFKAQHGSPLSGMQLAPSTKRDEALHLAAGFSNLYIQNARETTLTSFLEEHGEILKRAFGATHVFYQPELPWREGNPESEEKSIQPDVILKRDDGSWAIVEFKLPLLERTDLTRGEHRRRRFISPVYEGISQLANYEDYFTHSGNRQAALNAMGECPTDPQLILVVGTLENTDLRKIEEAKRAHREFDVVDYDSLLRIFIGNVPT